ncbi:MAG: hemolysin family protein [Pirellulales bacterium]
MNPEFLFWIAFGNLFLTSLAAVGARSLREFSRSALEDLCHKHRSDLKFSEILKHDDQVAVSIESLHVVTTAIFVSAIASWTYLRADATDPVVSARFWSTTLLASLALLTFKIWIPWAVVRLWATPILFYTWRLWRIISLILVPLVYAARLVDTVLHRIAGRQQVEPTEELFEEEIRSIVSEGHREGLLEEDAREMIEGVIELSDADVAKVMTPRTDVDMISVDLTWPEVVDFVVKCIHTRIPVYQGTRDEVVGVLHSKDLLPILANGRDRPPLVEVLRDPLFVPETKRLDDLLEEFQQTHNHMALVLDEYGGVAGLVTIEDVLEEIVGEIVDEYDEDVKEEFQEIDQYTTELLARAHVDEVNERLGLSLPEEEDFDTIGGFLFSQLGHVPTAGEQFVWQEVRFEVIDASPRRIERLRIVLPQPHRETA